MPYPIAITILYNTPIHLLPTDKASRRYTDGDVLNIRPLRVFPRDTVFDPDTYTPLTPGEFPVTRPNGQYTPQDPGFGPRELVVFVSNIPDNKSIRQMQKLNMAHEDYQDNTEIFTERADVYDAEIATNGKNGEYINILEQSRANGLVNFSARKNIVKNRCNFNFDITGLNPADLANLLVNKYVTVATLQVLSATNNRKANRKLDLNLDL